MKKAIILLLLSILLGISIIGWSKPDNSYITRVAVTAGDTTTVDFRLRKESTDISVNNSAGFLTGSMKCINGVIVCNLIADNGVLTVYSASGKAIVRKELVNGYNHVSIPKIIANQVVFASIKSGVKASYHRVVLP